jgi:hypothetical protein
LHLRPQESLNTLYLLVGSVIWLLAFLDWAFLLIYRNVKTGRFVRVAVKEFYDRNDGPIIAAHVSITLKRLWNCLPGPYVYLTIPNLGYLSLLQVHPYAVC